VDVFVADDAKQRKPTRRGMGPLVAVGGLHVPSDAIRALERDLDQLCRDTGFPRGQEFKWSPDKRSWMRKNLQGDAREQFFVAALERAREAGATALVVIEDARKRPASQYSANAEEDVVTMFLERAHNHLARTGTEAMVVADRPGGGSAAEKRFLANCLETLRSGTDWVIPERLALVLTTDSTLVRLLQLADVVTGSTLAYVSGESTYSPRLFPHVKPLLRQEMGRVGGCGVKIHPDFTYVNLYHWLLGDDYLVRGNVGHPLPEAGRAYPDSADVP
jgi:hypothetical protein